VAQIRTRWLAPLVAASLVVGSSTAVAQTTASLTLSPTSGPPGTAVSASGVFAGACGVRLFWDAVGGVVLAEAPAGRDGSYAITVGVPSTAAVGSHLIVAMGLTQDRDLACALETGVSVRQPFEVTPAGGTLEARLGLSASQARPGEGIVLDAGGSTGQIVSFEFDLDGNGTHETACPGPRAAVVHNDRGSRQVGVRVVSSDGQASTDTALLEIAGTPAQPPSVPGGGRAKRFQPSTVVGTCVADGQANLDAIVKAWMCPQTIFVGVVEATFRKYGVNAADEDACFERLEEALFGKKVVAFVASKNEPAAVGNPVLVNGLEFDHPVETTWPKPFYKNELMFVETIPLLGAHGPYGPSSPKTSDFRITMRGAGSQTSVASEPFSLSQAWDISAPGIAGWVTMGKATYLAQNEFLGLRVAKKLTSVRFEAGYTSRLTLHVTLPFASFQLVSAATSAIDALAFNDGNQPVVSPAGKVVFRRRAAAPITLSFTGIKLGIFTMNANLTYQQQGASEVWSGSMTLIFPGNVKVDGTLVIRDGEFESAHVQETPGPPGWGPIGCCVWIYSIFGDLTPLYVGAGANFGIGPEVPVVGVRAAEVTGQAQIFYGDPWSFVLSASDLRLVGIPVNASAKVMVSSNGFLGLAFLDEDWGPLEMQANLEAKVTASTWFAGGAATVCVDLEVLEGCGGGAAGIGKEGVAGCAVIPYLPDGGVALRWKFFTGDLLAWDLWWGCSFGDVKAEAGGKALAAARALAPDGLARQDVRVPAGLPKALFAIEGAGAAPKVELTGPDGEVVASDPGSPTASGPGWTILELPHDDTTYLTIERPAPGKWTVRELPGSTITSIGLARGLPSEMAEGEITGRGRARTLSYEIADVDGAEVTFVEHGGDPGDPTSAVEHVIGKARGAIGTLRFVAAEGAARRRTIEAVISIDGIPVRTEEIATFTAPKLVPLPAPTIAARRSGRYLLLDWSKVAGASFYRIEVDRSDGATDAFDRRGTRLRIGGLTRRTVVRIAIRAVSRAGYFGAMTHARI